MGLWEHRGFTVEDEGWPLVRCRFPPQPDTDGYTRLFEQYAELARRGGSIAWLVDMRGFNPLTSPPTVRKAAAEVFERHRDALARVTLCEARVIDGAAVRGVVTAFDWLTGNKWPCSNFATPEEARTWIDEQRARAAQR
jgi:hypothetical protein